MENKNQNDVNATESIGVTEMQLTKQEARYLFNKMPSSWEKECQENPEIEALANKLYAIGFEGVQDDD